MSTRATAERSGLVTTSGPVHAGVRRAQGGGIFPRFKCAKSRRDSRLCQAGAAPGANTSSASAAPPLASTALP